MWWVELGGEGGGGGLWWVELEGEWVVAGGGKSGVGWLFVVGCW